MDLTKTARALLGVAAASLGIGSAVPALALDWPWRSRARHCDRCGKPIPSVAYPFDPAHPFPPPTAYLPTTPVAPGAEPTIPAPGTAESPPAAGNAGQPAPGATPPGQPGAAPEAGQPPAPGEAATPAGGEAAPPAPSSGLGGSLGEVQGALNMFGDIAPFSRLAARQAHMSGGSSGHGFRPPPPPSPSPGHHQPQLSRQASLIPSVRSFKIADNQTPMPVDRVSYSFNYFDNLNGAINKSIGAPISGIQGYRHVLGFEKTFLDQNASFGMRLPLNTISANSPFPTLGQTSTAVGDLSAYFKYALWIDRPQGRVLTAGMAVTMPTGPTTFGGARYLRGLHYTDLQPFLAAQWTSGRWYLIDFTSIDVPTSNRDVTAFYQDVALGYFVYRNANPDGFIQSIAPNLEVHVNTPFNHRHSYSPTDVAATPEVVDLTEGVNIFFKNRTVLSLGIVDPVTGPRPFALEALALLNVFF